MPDAWFFSKSHFSSACALYQSLGSAGLVFEFIYFDKLSEIIEGKVKVEYQGPKSKIGELQLKVTIPEHQEVLENTAYLQINQTKWTLKRQVETQTLLSDQNYPPTSFHSDVLIGDAALDVLNSIIEPATIVISANRKTASGIDAVRFDTVSNGSSGALELFKACVKNNGL